MLFRSVRLERRPAGGRAALKPDSFLGARAAKLAREEGVIVRGIRDLVALSPPFVVSTDEVDLLLAGLSRALDRLIG